MSFNTKWLSQVSQVSQDGDSEAAREQEQSPRSKVQGALGGEAVSTQERKYNYFQIVLRERPAKAAKVAKVTTPATPDVAHPAIFPDEPTKGACFVCGLPVTWHRPGRNEGNALEGLVNAFGDAVHLRCPT
jgi:hypothetical protein